MADKYVKQFISLINEIKLHDRYTVFNDWCAMTAISIQNAVWFRDELEKEYITTAKKYKPDEMDKFVQMAAVIVNAYEENRNRDFLGDVFMEMLLNDKAGKGQVFTPYNIAEAMAKMTFSKENCEKMFDGKKYIKIHDPAVGGGCLLIAVANQLQEQGYNPQKDCCMLAIDLDRRCVFMTYIQLSVLGIPAIVLRGDTLKYEMSEEYHTPAYVWDYVRFRDFTTKAEPDVKQEKGQLELL